jgi:hypothetical protein
MHPAHAKSKETSMKIELKTGAVKLSPHQTLRLRDAVGSTVCAVEGAVWITEENQKRDIVLEAGAGASSCYQVRNAGITLINSLSGEASVSLA